MQIVKGGAVPNLLKAVPIPKMFHAKQEFPKDRIKPKDIAPLIYRKLSKPGFGSKIRPGMRIAITAGSRGIRNGNIITKAVLGKAPILFAIPCMENAYDETCRIEAVAPEDILTREPELLMKGEAE